MPARALGGRRATSGAGRPRVAHTRDARVRRRILLRVVHHGVRLGALAVGALALATTALAPATVALLVTLGATGPGLTGADGAGGVNPW
jgi:hypothetical protein